MLKWQGEKKGICLLYYLFYFEVFPMWHITWVHPLYVDGYSVYPNLTLSSLQKFEFFSMKSSNQIIFYKLKLLLLVIKDFI